MSSIYHPIYRCYGNKKRVVGTNKCSIWWKGVFSCQYLLLDFLLKCNKRSIHLGGGFPVEGFPGSAVHQMHGFIEFFLCDGVQICLLGVDSSESAVGVLVLAPLSGGMGVTEVHLRPRVPLNHTPQGELRAAVVGYLSPERFLFHRCVHRSPEPSGMIRASRYRLFRSTWVSILVFVLPTTVSPSQEGPSVFGRSCIDFVLFDQTDLLVFTPYFRLLPRWGSLPMRSGLHRYIQSYISRCGTQSRCPTVSGDLSGCRSAVIFSSRSGSLSIRRYSSFDSSLLSSALRCADRGRYLPFSVLFLRNSRHTVLRMHPQFFRYRRL